MKNFNNYILIDPTQDGFIVTTFSQATGYNVQQFTNEDIMLKAVELLRNECTVVFADAAFQYEYMIQLSHDYNFIPVKFFVFSGDCNIASWQPCKPSTSVMLTYNEIHTHQGELESCIRGYEFLLGVDEDEQLESEREAGWIVYLVCGIVAFATWGLIHVFN